MYADVCGMMYDVYFRILTRSEATEIRILVALTHNVVILPTLAFCALTLLHNVGIGEIQRMDLFFTCGVLTDEFHFISYAIDRQVACLSKGF